MKPILLVLSLLLLSLGNGMAENASKTDAGQKTITIDIPSDLPPPPLAEKADPAHPFFSESPGTEVMEKIQELEERVEKLEKKVFPEEKGKAE